MTIYLDIALIENILMNYIILFATGVIYKTRTRVRNLLLSSLIGGVYAILSFTTGMKIYASIFLKIILSIAMVYIAFRAEKIKTLFKLLMLFYLVSFAFGGTAFALLYFIKPQDILIKNGVLTGTYPIKIAFLGAMIGFIILQLATKGIKNKLSKKDMFCDIEIQLEDKKLDTKAMIDTGNLLKEPITGLPVVVIETEELKGILPENIIENTENIISGNLKGIEDKYILRFRMIPFTSLGKQNGLLLGIKADKVIIKKEENSQIIKNAMIGMYNKSLTKSKQYHALIGLDMLEGGTNEFITDVKA